MRRSRTGTGTISCKIMPSGALLVKIWLSDYASPSQQNLQSVSADSRGPHRTDTPCVLPYNKSPEYSPPVFALQAATANAAAQR